MIVDLNKPNEANFISPPFTNFDSLFPDKYNILSKFTLLKKVKSRADIVSQQIHLLLSSFKEGFCWKRKNMSIGGQYIVSLSYREGEIIHIYHNQSLTSAFPTSV